MTLIFYYDILSQPCRALYIFLKANQIPFESRVVSLRKGEHLTEDYAKVNRFKKVPVIDDGGFKLSESIAIYRYLVREKNIGDQWYPKDSKLQAKVDEYLEWQHNNTRMACSLYVNAKWITPTRTGKANLEEIGRMEALMVKCLDEIENLWLGQPYIAGDRLTLADLVAACEIEQTRLAGYDPTEGRPKLKNWLDRVRNELSPHYQEAHAVLNKFAKTNSMKAKL